MKTTLESLPDELLLRRLVELLTQARVSEAQLVAHIGEVDARRLYARAAAPSMFVYCTERLHLSEAESYLRIVAARAARAHPVLLDMLADGRLHLTAVARLAPHLTAENRESVLARAVHRTKRQIEELVAELQPRPDVPVLIRKLPERPKPATSATADAPPADGVLAGSASADGVSRASTPEPTTPATFDATLPARIGLRPDAVAHLPASRLQPSSSVQPLAPGRYKVQFTASAALRDKLERLQALMRSSVPDGDLAAIIDEAVTEKLARLEARRFGRQQAAARPPSGAEANRPRPPVAQPGLALPVMLDRREPGEGDGALPTAPRTAAKPTTAPPRKRHIPAAVRREVYERDEGRCRYVDPQGRRCSARDGLEFHHRHPFGLGGEHTAGNVSLQCRAHNGLLAEIDFGRESMARHRGPRRREAAVEPA
jgi:hypothetical protein